MYKNLDKLSAQGLKDFADFAQQNPVIMAEEMDTGRRVSYKTLQDMMRYASYKAMELQAETEEEKTYAHKKAEDEYVKFPLRLRWRAADNDRIYAHLRNLDSFTDDELIKVIQKSVKELWDDFFPHISVGKETKPISKIRDIAKLLLKHRRNPDDENNDAGKFADNAHMFLPPWAQWRQHFDGYSSVQGKNLPIGSLCHHMFRYDPHTEPFVR